MIAIRRKSYCLAICLIYAVASVCFPIVRHVPDPRPECKPLTIAEVSYKCTDPVAETVVKTTVSPSRGVRSLRMTATAYCMGTTTATGLPVQRGVVAVDPSVIPYHTRIEIDGMGEFTAEDTGGDIQGNRIDIYMPSYNECMSFGVREVTVRVLR